MIDFFYQQTDYSPHAQIYLTASNRYIYRGVANKDEQPSLSAGLNINNPAGWFLDTWVGRDTDYSAPRSEEGYAGKNPWRLEKTDSTDAIQWDINAGYQFTLTPDWLTAVSHAWLLHNADYSDSNYQEWRAFGFYRSYFTMQLAYADPYRHFNGRYWNAELQSFVPLTKALNLELAVGESHGENIATDRLRYGWLGVNTSVQNFSITTRLHQAEILSGKKTVHRIELAISWGHDIFNNATN